MAKETLFANCSFTLCSEVTLDMALMRDLTSAGFYIKSCEPPTIEKANTGSLDLRNLVELVEKYLEPRVGDDFEIIEIDESRRRPSLNDLGDARLSPKNESCRTVSPSSYILQGKKPAKISLPTVGKDDGNDNIVVSLDSCVSQNQVMPLEEPMEVDCNEAAKIGSPVETDSAGIGKTKRSSLSSPVYSSLNVNEGSESSKGREETGDAIGKENRVTKEVTVIDVEKEEEDKNNYCEQQLKKKKEKSAKANVADASEEGEDKHLESPLFLTMLKPKTTSEENITSMSDEKEAIGPSGNNVLGLNEKEATIKTERTLDKKEVDCLNRDKYAKQNQPDQEKQPAKSNEQVLTATRNKCNRKAEDIISVEIKDDAPNGPRGDQESLRDSRRAAKSNVTTGLYPNRDLYLQNRGDELTLSTNAKVPPCDSQTDVDRTSLFNKVTEEKNETCQSDILLERNETRFAQERKKTGDAKYFDIVKAQTCNQMSASRESRTVPPRKQDSNNDHDSLMYQTVTKTDVSATEPQGKPTRKDYRLSDSKESGTSCEADGVPPIRKGYRLSDSEESGASCESDDPDDQAKYNITVSIQIEDEIKGRIIIMRSINVLAFKEGVQLDLDSISVGVIKLSGKRAETLRAKEQVFKLLRNENLRFHELKPKLNIMKSNDDPEQSKLLSDEIGGLEITPEQRLKRNDGIKGLPGISNFSANDKANGAKPNVSTGAIPKHSYQPSKPESPQPLSKTVQIDLHISCDIGEKITLISHICNLPNIHGYLKVLVSLGELDNGIISFQGNKEEVDEIVKRAKTLLRNDNVLFSEGRSAPKRDTNSKTQTHERSSGRVSSVMVEGESKERHQNYETTYQANFQTYVGRKSLASKDFNDQAYQGSPVDISPYERHSNFSEFSTLNHCISVKVIKADITSLSVDVVVNAANSRLRHGGGVAKAIATKAGSALQQECSEFTKGDKKVAVSDLFVSSAGNLPCRYVFHAVGPKWEKYGFSEKDKCAQVLRRTVLRCLVEASKRGLESIALPSISAAIFKVPMGICTKSYLEAVQTFDLYIDTHSNSSLKKVFFVDVAEKTVEDIHRHFSNNWTCKPSSEQLERDFTFIREDCRKKTDFVKTSQQNSAPKNSPRLRSSSPDKKGLLASEATQGSENTAGQNVDTDYHFGHASLRVSTEAAIHEHPDAILVVGNLFQKLHWSPAVNVESKLTKCDAAPHKKDAFTILEGAQFPIIVQFFLDKHDQDGIDKTFKNLKSYLKSIFDFLPQVETFVLTSHLLYACGQMKYPDSKLVGSFSRNVFEILTSSTVGDLLQGRRTNVRIASGTDAVPMIHKVFSSRLEKRSSKLTLTGDQLTETEECGICFENCKLLLLSCCNASMCLDCKNRVRRCPFCQKPFGILKGNQPNGSMSVERSSRLLPKGHKSGMFTVTYYFPSSVQGPEHPNPGRSFTSVTRFAYLPASSEGLDVLILLKLAFLRRLTFTIGKSLTTGKEGVITWNGIHHKTSLQEGHAFGYPDPNYLNNVTKELADRGVTRSSMTEREKKYINPATKTIRLINGEPV